MAMFKVGQRVVNQAGRFYSVTNAVVPQGSVGTVEAIDERHLAFGTFTTYLVNFGEHGHASVANAHLLLLPAPEAPTDRPATTGPAVKPASRWLDELVRVCADPNSTPAIVRSALAAYEATGDHNHGTGRIRPGAPCSGGDCIVAKARALIGAEDTSTERLSPAEEGEKAAEQEEAQHFTLGRTTEAVVVVSERGSGKRGRVYEFNDRLLADNFAANKMRVNPMLLARVLPGYCDACGSGDLDALSSGITIPISLDHPHLRGKRINLCACCTEEVVATGHDAVTNDARMEVEFDPN